MERQFYNEDFERLLKDNANQYKMYPSEKVWKGINSALHSRRRWYGISALAMLLISASLVTVFVVNNNITSKQLAENSKSKSPKNNFIQKTTSTIGIKNPMVNPAASQTIQKGKDLNSFQPIVNSAPSEQLIIKNEEPFSNVNSSFVKTKNSEKEISENSANEFQPVIKGKINSPLVPEVQNNQSISQKINDNLISTDLLYNEMLAIASNLAPVPVKKRQARLTGQFYFTPTVSYRTLTENKKYYSANGTYGYFQVDVNNLVKHKPAMGLEFGMEAKYRLTDRLSFKTGLQFNINRYDIRAYSHSTEIATVAIDRGYRTDSLASLSNYRNFNGYSSNWLQNFYFQVALPVGAEIMMSQNKNVNWGISATVQPTYVIGDRAYLISSDYQNYAKFPDLMRRWNISTGIETFVSYSTGKINWQVGPHVRYQHLSSFVSAYPVKENLFAVGLKVGATISKRK